MSGPGGGSPRRGAPPRPKLHGIFYSYGVSYDFVNTKTAPHLRFRAPVRPRGLLLPGGVVAGHADRTLPLILAEPCVSSPVSQKGRTSSSPYTSPGRIGGSVILVSRSVLVIAVKPSLLAYSHNGALRKQDLGGLVVFLSDF